MDEAPVWIAINDVRRVLLTCSPVDLEALAVGHLLAERWIGAATQVRALRVVDGPGGAFGVEVEIPEDSAAAAAALHRHRLAHGCGLRHVLDCETPAARNPAPEQPPHALGDAFRALFAAADTAAAGGVHAAGFCGVDGDLAAVAVDVARHCAVDRAIGRAARGDVSAAGGLLTSSRISGAIALKAAQAGVPWVASRSIATPLAREIAAALGVRLVEQAVRRV
jgi:FdhD protein